MAGLRQGIGIEFQKPAESMGGLYGRTFAKSVFGLSDIFGDPREGMKLSSAGVKFRMRTGRTTAVGPRESNEDAASDNHTVGTATAFRTATRSVELTALTALYTAEITADMIADAVGVDPNALEGHGSYLDFYKGCVEEDIQWRMGLDLLGGNRTGSLATVQVALAIGDTSYAARRSVSQATAGARGALALGQDVVFVFADPVTGQRIGTQAHRVTSIVLGGATGGHDTVNFTPALLVAVPAGSVICEATNPDSFSFARGFYSIDEIATDALGAPTLYGQSRIAHAGLSAKVLRDGTNLRKFVPSHLNQLFRTIDMQANLRPGDMYACIMSRGLADDIWTSAASVAAGIADVAPAGGGTPILDRQNAYAPSVEQVWGTDAFVMRCPWAPGGRLLIIATDYAICNSAVFVPLSSLHKYIAFPPEWLPGPIAGTGHKTARRFQATHSWWCSATQVFDNVPAIGRIDDLADLQIAAAQGGAGV